MESLENGLKLIDLISLRLRFDRKFRRKISNSKIKEMTTDVKKWNTEFYSQWSSTCRCDSWSKGDVAIFNLTAPTLPSNLNWPSFTPTRLLIITMYQYWVRKDIEENLHFRFRSAVNYLTYVMYPVTLICPAGSCDSKILICCL